tara:strand:+ start:194 stop:610 length:417 start_codon:yes stop_codon:yes gene_type:complete
MKKIYIILSLLALSVIWAQKEVPGEGGTLEATGDERLNGKKIQPIDANVVQQVRMLKANKEKAFMKKQILSAQKVDTKTFKVSQQESKFLVVKQIIETIKSDSKTIKSEKLIIHNEPRANVFDETFSKNILESRKNDN